MHKRMMGWSICFAAFAVSSAAQTVTAPVAGTANTVPLFTGATTIGNSVITQSSGKVGIGTASPAGLLHLYGSNPGLFIDSIGSGGATWRVAADNSGRFWIQSPSININPFQISPSGWTGIGTGANLQPQAPLHIGGYVSTGEIMRLTNNFTPTNGNAAGIMFNLYNASSAFVNVAEVSGVITNTTASAYTGALTFLTANNAAPAERMRIDNYGNVGIGTNAPAYKLDVTGQIHSATGYVFPDGTTQSTAFIPANCGADYAEAVDVSGDRTKYEPGDVLVIDPSAPGKFLKGNQAYSTLVAGIYSTKPGFVGRLHPEDAKTDKTEVPMAMVGRVPTKVSAENGPIKVGDLLVASSTTGYAMKGTDRSQMLGAVIGKALGSLDSGKGVIEVLVTLL